MREIKFRARNAEVPRCWIYGYFVKEWGCNYIINNDGKFKVIAGTECQYLLRSTSPMHQKEIYEGDIVRLDGNAFVNHEVFWYEPTYQYLLRSTSPIHQTHFLGIAKDSEVIGNIYENPKLLEGD